ncbi:MAG: hypothetical protein E7391_04960 [Ruminococcaceae bacterium]|nr:hypothetical protein [Oscillospiraceae bacterium]
MIYVLPNPVSLKENEGDFIIDKKLYFIIPKSFSNEGFISISKELFSNYTANKFELEIVKSDNLKNAVISYLSSAKISDAKTEYEYELDVKNDRIDIISDSEIGIIHAFSSFLQLIGAYSLKNNNCKVKCVTIKDKPSLKFRGMHLCVFSDTSILFLRKMVRLLGLLKCSHVILEFWGTLKLDSFKYLAWENSYTKDDIKPIIEDGKSLGIEFIPMFNHFGHATYSRSKTGKNVVLDQATEYEEYFSEDGWTWNVKNEDVLKIHQSVREELCDLFGKGEYFHIGCDEVFMEDFRYDPYDKEDNDTFVNFINKSAKSVLDMGRKPIIWGDMFLIEDDFPYPFCRNASGRCYDRKNIDRLLDEIIIDDWQYNVEEDKDETVKYFMEKKKRENIILSPWDGNVWKGNPTIKGRCALAKKHNLLGVLGTTWNGIYKEIRSMLYTACLMWEEDETNVDKIALGALTSLGAKNIRKLMPPNGDPQKAGFYGGGEMLNIF